LPIIGIQKLNARKSSETVRRQTVKEALQIDSRGSETHLMPSPVGPPRFTDDFGADVEAVNPETERVCRILQSRLDESQTRAPASYPLLSELLQRIPFIEQLGLF
jgi:hypothetical protein